MKILFKFLLLAVAAMLFAAPAMANEDDRKIDRIQGEQNQFSPEQVGKALEQKGEQLMELARSGSVFYISAAFVMFLLLLIGGLFSSKLLRAAFFLLSVAGLGYLVLNYWPEIKNSFMAFIEWLFSNTEGNAGAAASDI